MIPYEDLVAALASWRARNGLPTITADALFASPSLAPLGAGDLPEVVEMTDGIVEELDAAEHLIDEEEGSYEYEAAYEGQTYDEPVDDGQAAADEGAYESDAIAAELAADVDYDLGDEPGEVVYEAPSEDEATAYGEQAGGDEATAYAGAPAEDPATIGDEGFADDDEHTAFGGAPTDDADLDAELDAALDAGALVEEELDAEPPPSDDEALALDDATRVGGDFADAEDEATSLADVPGPLDDDEPAGS